VAAQPHAELVVTAGSAALCWLLLVAASGSAVATSQEATPHQTSRVRAAG
jgi:hypothetical protein